MLILAAIGVLIAHGHRFAIDRALLVALRQPGHAAVPIGPEWLERTLIDFTALGSGPVLTLAVAVGALVLLLKRCWASAALLLAATISGSVIVHLAKAWVDRARPVLIPHLVEESSRSFPSSHAANGAIVWLMLAMVAARFADEPAVRRFLIAAALLLVVVLGASRVYLGVHWPTDVLVGWGFGLLWAAAWRPPPLARSPAIPPP